MTPTGPVLMARISKEEMRPPLSITVRGASITIGGTQHQSDCTKKEEIWKRNKIIKKKNPKMETKRR